MEANENNLQDLQQNEETPKKGFFQKNFPWFVWCVRHMFDWWMRLLILCLLMIGVGAAWIAAIVFEIYEFAHLSVLVGFVLSLAMLGNGIFCIIDFFYKKRFKEGLIVLVVSVCLACMTFVGCLLLLTVLVQPSTFREEIIHFF